MHPIFHIGPFPLPAYGSIIAIGLVLGIILATFLANQYGYMKFDVILSTILASVGIMVGAKLLYMLTVIPSIIQHASYSKEHVPEVISYLFGGYVFYGGLIGALIAYNYYCKGMHYSFLRFSNIIAPSIPLVHAFGRIGCFMGGCCYGIHYDGPLSVTFPKNEFVESLGTEPRFPVQLLEAAINFLLFLVLFTYAKKKVRKDGCMLGIYFICYAIIRFSLEFLRGDVERGILFGVSTSQWISLILIPIGIWLLKRTPSETIEEKEENEDILSDSAN